MNKPLICCLDLEGVLIPEIWINVAERTKIKALRLTTRDEPDYDKLMKMRLRILREEGIRLKDIQAVIGKMNPLPGAKNFLDKLRAKSEVIILSDTYYEFAAAFLKKLGHPTLFCNSLSVDSRGFIKNYHLRQKNGKEKAARALRKIGFEVRAAGDSYNDITMLKAADRGVLFNPPANIAREFPGFPTVRTHNELFSALSK